MVLKPIFIACSSRPIYSPVILPELMYFRPEDGSFQFQQGPIFHNLILADEINRAPAKVQSALLEAMAERQVSIGQTSYPLPELFLVMATQNPIEQEGTYPLPEAQLDRFLMHVSVDYPNADAEREILRSVREEAKNQQAATLADVVSQEAIFAARQQILSMHCAPAVEEYIVQLIMATRNPDQYEGQLAQWLEFGASPRATIALDRCARAHAWLHNQDYVGPDNVQAVAANVLRHRIILSFDAEAQGITTDDVIATLLAQVAVG